MIDVNYLALGLAIVAAFVLSTGYYVALGRRYAELRGLSPEAAAASPLALASIHAGDWLLKLVAIASIVGPWR